MVEEILSPSDRMAEPGGPIKTILDFASVSGRRGFSEACPLCQLDIERFNLIIWGYSPSGPDGVDACSLSDIDDKVDVGVVIVVGSSWDFHESVCHSNVLGIDT